MIKITTPVIRTFALAALVGSFAFAFPAHAQTSDMSEPSAEQAAPPAATHMKKHDGMMNVETRIKTLHDKLMINAAEENDWNAFAQTMRDNETSIHQLIEERHQNADSLTAVDDLQSYQKIAQAHADGMQKLTESFKAVYNDMSDDQKKNADTVFSTFEGHGHGGKMHGKKHSS
jgi:hypothetical protein